MTDAEQLLWLHLRDRRFAGAKFRRQEPIGQYFADFCCVERELIIEVDGGQHDDAAQIEYDRWRTADFERRGFRVPRFWNNEVLGELTGVLEAIEEIIASPHPVPLPEGEGTLEEEAIECDASGSPSP
jgi:adenine-specific DNA-methyltransferase